MASKVATFTFYSFVGSQWAGVVHLTLAEKGFADDDYNLKEIDLFTADNFDPEYLKINPNGTIPSLTSPALEKPLTESADILRYLDNLRGSTLIPDDPALREKAQALIKLVHSNDVGTNLILLQARDADEMEGKQNSMWKTFVGNRQEKLEKEHEAHPDHPFYGPKADENGSINKFYVNPIGDGHQEFFARTHEMYRVFAAGMNKLEALLVLPYATGEKVTEADFHIAPWLSHALWGAGTDPADVQNFGVLEALIGKSVPGFRVGPKTREWWSNMADTKAFKKVFPTLH